MFNLDGKVALVTGGGRDIGRAVSLELARLGADVVVNYHQSAEGAQSTVSEIEALGRRAVAVQADVRKVEDIRSMVAQALDFGGGRVDVLVNNAGGMVRRAGLEELTPELLDDSGLPG